MLIGITILLVSLFLAFMMLVAIMRVVRRRSVVTKEVELHTDFSVADLHQLFAAGKISKVEFERARDSVLRRVPKTSPKLGHGFQVMQNDPAQSAPTTPPPPRRE